MDKPKTKLMQPVKRILLFFLTLPFFLLLFSFSGCDKNNGEAENDNCTVFSAEGRIISFHPCRMPVCTDGKIGRYLKGTGFVFEFTGGGITDTAAAFNVPDELFSVTAADCAAAQQMLFSNYRFKLNYRYTPENEKQGPQVACNGYDQGQLPGYNMLVRGREITITCIKVK